METKTWTLGAVASLKIKNNSLLDIGTFHAIPHAMMKQQIKLGYLRRSI